MGVSPISTGIASNHQFAASSAPWARERLARRVKSEPAGFGFWANKLNPTAALN